MRSWLVLLAAIAVLLVPGEAAPQDTTGQLIAVVTDASGGVVAGAQVRITSPALIGELPAVMTGSDGRARFNAMPPGSYALEVVRLGFDTIRDEGIPVVAGERTERRVALSLKKITEYLAIDGSDSTFDVRHGLGKRYGIEELRAQPTRRSGVPDVIKTTPGISPTSPSSGTQNTLSVFGSSTNENAILFDGVDNTSPSNGVARVNLPLDFVQEIQVQTIGAPVEHGNYQGGVFNVEIRQGSEQFLVESSYYAQPAGLISQPVQLPLDGVGEVKTGYERARFRDVSTTFGGPAIHERVWFFAGIQHFRDYDSQPGTDPKWPRTIEQDRLLAKVNWRPARGVQIMQSALEELWTIPEFPTQFKPIESTVKFNGRVSAITFGDLAFTRSDRMVVEVRAGRFNFEQHDDPWGPVTEPSRSERNASVTSFTGPPPQIGAVTTRRTTAKATLSQYVPRFAGSAHELKLGGEFGRGGHDSLRAIPTGVRFIDRAGGQPFQMIMNEPSVAGGLVINAAAFVSDRFSIGERLAFSVGLRYDRSQAASQDLPARTEAGAETGAIIAGLGQLYTWNNWSPRVSLIAKLSRDGRSVMRGGYGRYVQGAFSGESSLLHPGTSSGTTYDFDRAVGDYVLRSDPPPVELDRGIQAPRTDEYFVSLDRELGSRFSISLSYVRKNGTRFIGWTEAAGTYHERSLVLTETLSVPLYELKADSPERIYRLTNPPDYSTTYDGLIVGFNKRLSSHFMFSLSYELSRAYGELASSGTTAAGAQISTPGSPPITYGRDPNDSTNARGRLPNDRPQIARGRLAVDVPHTGIQVTANMQYFSGKPWAPTTLVRTLPAPQSGEQRILTAPRGSRRLSSQAVVDWRVARMVRFGPRARIELMLDVLNAFNDTSEEALISDRVFDEPGRPTVPQPAVYMDPRRVMLGARFSFGKF